jgi:glycosyltransferase involved in cell wall biosynthesis
MIPTCPRVSFIVSAYHRPAALRCCLSCLVLQSETSWEAIVMDNSTDPAMIEANRAHCRMDPRIRHFSSVENQVTLLNCYYASEYAVEKLAAGDWVGFPSDDSLYTPYYASKLLHLADQANLELVYSNLVMEGPDNNGVLDCEARVCMLDKTNFLVKRSRFIPWPAKHPEGLGSCSDGELIAELVRQGIRHGKVPQLLAVHV